MARGHSSTSAGSPISAPAKLPRASPTASPADRKLPLTAGLLSLLARDPLIERPAAGAIGQLAHDFGTQVGRRQLRVGRNPAQPVAGRAPLRLHHLVYLLSCDFGCDPGL